MTAPWKALAEPFPDNEVKTRPGSATWDHKADCRGRDCRETKDPAKHKQLSYVDAAAVIRRLNEALEPHGWDFTSTVIPGTDIVRGELTIGGVVRVDYGYPNSEHDAEPIKSASSDALKRCATLFGIGLHLRGDNTASGGRGVPSSSPRPSAPPRPRVLTEDPHGVVPDFPPNEWEEPQEFPPIGGTPARPGDVCDEHNEPWRGEVGDLFHGPKPYHRHPSNVKKARGA